jgi:hypothetical protein
MSLTHRRTARSRRILSLYSTIVWCLRISAKWIGTGLYRQMQMIDQLRQRRVCVDQARGTHRMRRREAQASDPGVAATGATVPQDPAMAFVCCGTR